MSMNAPMRHIASPIAALTFTFSFMMIGDSSATHTGDRQASRVALAMDVSRIARCQKNRSPAKKIPEYMTGFENCIRLSFLFCFFSSTAQASSIGRAYPSLQNALANGPTSASRTNMGEAPIPHAPAARAMNATDHLYLFI